MEFLDKNLPHSWNIYVQPYVNDMRPDVVVVNPQVGLVVFEVKDWDLSLRQIEKGKLIGRTSEKSWVDEDPLTKARWYAKSLYEQFLICDEAELELGLQPNNLSLFRHAVYFHGTPTDVAERLYRDKIWSTDILLGEDKLLPDNLDQIVPYYFMARSKLIRDSQVTALEEAHHWLVPPLGAIEQQKPLPQLTAQQRPYATPEQGFRRIRGVAGAGKSLVLAHRATTANREGRKVLVLSFNITMSHVLHDLLKRDPHGLNWQRVTWNHFHGWAKTQAVHAGLDLAASDDSDTGVFENVARVLEQIIRGEGTAQDYEMPKYGGIYIDEGQDFEPAWLDALSAFLEPGGELVLFADHRQNLYGKDGGKDSQRSMKRCRFSGKWAQLPRKSQRLPWRIAMFLNEFAQDVTLGDEEDLAIEDYAERPVQGDLQYDVLAWKPITSTDAAFDALDDALAIFGNPHPNDVVVLFLDHSSGMRAVEALLPKYLKITHVFGANKEESRRRKVAFWMGNSGLKMCTVHSFKGWELAHVIVVWPSEIDLMRIPSSHQNSLFYTAISRGLRNMVVLNANRSYDRYFNEWDQLPVSGGT